MPLGEPPSDLTAFPAFLLDGHVFARIHRTGRDPVHFSNSGEGRFDVAEGGTLYLAQTPVGAFLEVVRGAVVAAEEVSARSLALVEVGRVRLADLTAEAARGFGITAEIHSTPDYEICQRWATALSAAGFAGVRYRLRHDPAGGEIGLALFDEQLGRSRIRAVADGPVTEELVEQVRARFGVVVLPARLA